MIKADFPLFRLLRDEYAHLSIFFSIAFIIGILLALAYSLTLLMIGLFALSVFLLILYKTRPIGVLLLFLVSGYLIMSSRLTHIISPTLEKPIQVELQGQVQQSHLTEKGSQLILGDISFLNRADISAPDRIKLNTEHSFIKVGDTIQALCFLRPPLPQIDPDGYNESQILSFQKIGAVGTVLKLFSWKQSSSSFSSILDTTRKNIAVRIRNKTPPEVSEILIPLAIGDQSVVSQKLYNLFHGAGITHILSVSGFHLSLLAAFLFLLIRRLFAFFPRAEYISTKKIAAALALIGCTCYIFISGMQIPAIRSWIMIAIVLIALLFDRNAFSVRSLSIAAVLILLFAPELILNIGFQLSFMAVLIIVTLYPKIRQFIFPNNPSSFPIRFLRLVFSFMALDLLINFTTAPLIIYHFNRYALYSPISNVLTGTIFSFWIMPCLFTGLFLMPLGCDTLFLKAASIGIEYIIVLCDKITQWPYSNIIFPSFSVFSLLIMTLGIIILCLNRTSLKWLGVIVLSLGIICAIYSQKPDILIGNQGKTIAVRTENGLQFLSAESNDTTASIWLLHNGQQPNQKIETSHLPALISLKGKQISFTEETCFKADICFLPGQYHLDTKIYPLHLFETRAIYINQDQIHVKTLTR